MSELATSPESTELTEPDVALHATWAAAMTELRVEGEHVPGAGIWMLPDAERWDLTETGCLRTVSALRGALDPPAGADDALVPCHSWWLTTPGTEGPEVVGFLALRTRLTAGLLNDGGHIGYSVVPSRRRRGHASRGVDLAVRRAGAIGLTRVLLTCDETNVASARTIESGGGRYEDSRHGKRRYWIETARAGAPDRGLAT